MLAQHEREDMLRLLTVVAQYQGATRLAEEYETPREEWAATVEEMGWTPGQAAADRQAAVRAFIDAAEG